MPERMQRPEHASTAWSIARCARDAGGRTAIVEDGVRFSYATMARDLCRCVAGLEALGIAPDMLAGIELRPQRYLNLLLLLACEVIGATTVSLRRADLQDDDDPVLPDCDILLMRDAAPAPRRAVLQAIPDDWLAQLANGAPDGADLARLMRAAPPDQIVSVVRTSGTTGRPKALELTLSLWQRLIDLHMQRLLRDTGPNPVSLCVYNLGVRAFNMRVSGILQHGGTVIFAPEQHACPLLASGTVNHALFTVGDLERLIPQATPPPPDHVLRIETVGAGVSRRLRALIEQNLHARISATYSSNETGIIADNDADDVGTLCEGAAVRIVDDAGNDRPPGVAGLIRAKSSTMVHGYRNAPALTAAAFIDGWYVTNDIGYLTDAGRLVVLGRADDMLNIGGVKLSPRPIEEALRELPGIADAALISVPTDNAVGMLVAAVQIDADTLPGDLASRVDAVLSRATRHYRIMPLRWFPRTVTGKVRRDELKAAFLRGRDHSPSP